MKKFLILVKKEVKELLTLQTLAPLLAVVVVFMFLGKAVGKESAKNEGKQTIALVDLDRSGSSALAKQALESRFSLDIYSTDDAQQAVKQAQDKGDKVVVVIPQGFGHGLDQKQPQKLEVYTVMNNFSFLGAKSGQQAALAVQTVNEALSNQFVAAQTNSADPAFLKNPIVNDDYVRVGQKQAQTSPTAISSFISQQTTFIPIVLFMVIIFASQMITASMAAEKENKTLETLLSAPISRQSIIAAKLVGASLVALVTAGVYLIGMRYYINGMTAGLGGASAQTTIVSDAVKNAAVQLGLVLSFIDYVMLGLSLFFGILAALSISIILSSFAEDTKSAQSMIAPLMMLILIPYFFTMFLDIGTLSPIMKWLIYAIPFTHPFLAAPNLMLGNRLDVLWGILYMAGFFAVFVFIASKIFASDKILTMRLKFGKKGILLNR